MLRRGPGHEAPGAGYQAVHPPAFSSSAATEEEFSNTNSQ